MQIVENLIITSVVVIAFAFYIVLALVIVYAIVSTIATLIEFFKTK